MTDGSKCAKCGYTYLGHVNACRSREIGPHAFQGNVWWPANQKEPK